MPAGRPTNYKPEYCEALIKHCSEGLSFESFAAQVSTTSDVLYDWVEKHEEFASAKKEGLALALEFYEKIGRNGMLGKLPGFNVTAWIFTMKNRFKWRDHPIDSDAGEKVITISFK